MSAEGWPEVVIYTDGACRGNPGPGGYGAILISGGHRRELSGGRRLTTNNRMELLGAIQALAALPQPSRVILYTDSQYLVQAIQNGWALRWRRQHWRTAAKQPARNSDLWQELLQRLETHQATFRWVKGHASDADNARADALAVAAAAGRDLPADELYERPPAADGFLPGFE